MNKVCMYRLRIYDKNKNLELKLIKCVVYLKKMLYDYIRFVLLFISMHRYLNMTI